jgi:hypothetical protein
MAAPRQDQNPTFTRAQRFLMIYSGVLTIVFAVTLLSAFSRQEAPTRKKVSFDEIDVHRINIVEPDGTLRMVLSNTPEFPGIIVKGKEYPHPNRKTAGMLFFNDEGTENGGLTFGGSKDKDGKVSSGGHLSFDQYMQDQVLSLDANEHDGKRQYGITLVDYPDYSIMEVIDLIQRIKSLPEAEQKAEIDKFYTQHPKPQPRLRLGRERDLSAALRLKDIAGRDRIVIMVKPDGSPILQFLDEQGKVTMQLPPAQSN